MKRSLRFRMFLRKYTPHIIVAFGLLACFASVFSGVIAAVYYLW